MGAPSVGGGLTTIGSRGATRYGGGGVFTRSGTRRGHADTVDRLRGTGAGVLPRGAGAGVPDGIWSVELGQFVEQVSTPQCAIADDGVE